MVMGLFGRMEFGIDGEIIPLLVEESLLAIDSGIRKYYSVS
jgi:hypothetical protein